jgi:murein DD-endopeptidase MepM/ murein hydrolase activator NlpD
MGGVMGLWGPSFSPGPGRIRPPGNMPSAQDVGIGMKEDQKPADPLGERTGPGNSGFSIVGATDRPRHRPSISVSVAVFALALAFAALGLSLLLPAGLRPGEALREFFRETTPHEAYLMGLSETGLTATALGQDWMSAAQAALVRPLHTELPYQEEGFFPEEEAAALGYRVSLRRGQRLTVRVELDGVSDTRLFLDLYRVAPDTLRPPVHVFAPEPGSGLVFEPRRSGDYLLRIQPELLRGGRFSVTIERDAALEFPVAGSSTEAIGGVFGDPRDGGRRDHHGVDIFAPRGTPVVATSTGYISRVDTTDIGGRVIWLRDAQRGASAYYAHLNEPLVQAGARVEPGDTIGTVGNTGNARTTPPHLHFGLYFRREGPRDPWDYLYQPPGALEPVAVALEGLGQWARVRGDDIHLRDEPSTRAHILADLPRHTALRVTGGVGSWYRVRLPDGAGGFVSADLTEEVGEPLWLERVAQASPLRSDPLPGAPVMDQLPNGADLPVLGTFGDFLYVRGPAGRAGWVVAGGE